MTLELPLPIFSLIDNSSQKVHQQAAKIIAQNILSGKLREMQKLPNELDLCATLGISRTSLRESIKLLSAKGLLVSKPKLGTMILPRNNWNFFDSQLLEWIQDLDETGHFLKQFLGLRTAIEPEACALASLHATAEQRKKLSVVFQKMVIAATNQCHDNWIEEEHQFHQQIFIATGNSFYLPFANLMSTMFKTFIIESIEGRRCYLEEHQAIYNAIMAGNATRARIASQILLSNQNQILKRITTQ